MSDLRNPPDFHDQEEVLSSQSSDEKMDTGSESFISQGTPNSVLSSDFEERDQRCHEPISNTAAVLRLQNPSHFSLDSSSELDDPKIPDTNVLRLSEPLQTNDNHKFHNGASDFHSDGVTSTPEFCYKNKNGGLKLLPSLDDSPLNDSLVNQMSKLRLDSVDVNSDDEQRKSKRPLRLGISPPRLSSTLTLTADHPLMGLGSPDSVENYPDVIPSRVRKVTLKDDEVQKDLSLSSIEDDKPNTASDSVSFIDFKQDGPQRNTSKNNLYFSDNFTTADSNILNDSSWLSLQDTNVVGPPDVARIQILPEPRSLDTQSNRRKIVPCFRETDFPKNKVEKTSPLRVLGRVVDGCMGEKAINKYVEERNRRFMNSSRREDVPVVEISEPLEISQVEFADRSGVADWVESPSLLRSMPSFQLPIEMSTNIGNTNGLESPEALSSSTQENERSLYQATLDPYTGSVALRHTSCVANVSDTSAGRRRIIAVLPQDTEDNCSLDSASICSLNSEEADLECQEPGLERVDISALAEPPSVYEDQSVSDDDSRRGTGSEGSEPIPEYSAAEERNDQRTWLKVALPTGGYSSCDMRVIEPFKRVLSHGGYEVNGAAIIVFSACHLPDSSRIDYNYVMDNLFLYVLSTLDQLVTDDYVLVYLHGSASKHRLPTFHWLKKCYQLVDRRLRKSLKHLYLVHPTFWIKSIVLMSKPFISSKFYRKLSYVNNLAQLEERVPVQPAAIPDLVRQYDATRH